MCHLEEYSVCRWLCAITGNKSAVVYICVWIFGSFSLSREVRKYSCAIKCHYLCRMYRFMNHVRLDDHKLTVSLILYAWMSLELSGPGKSVACEGPHGLVSGKWGSLRSNPHLIPDPSMGNFLLITLPWIMILSIAFAGETSDKGTCRIIPHWSFDLFHHGLKGPKKQHNVTNK